MTIWPTDTEAVAQSGAAVVVEVPTTRAARKCRCAICDHETFARIFGYSPIKGERRRTRRTSEEVAAAKREADAIKSRKAEARARFYGRGGE